MADAPGHTHGSFCWHEIGTHDAKAAKAFYGALLGWSLEDRPMGPNPEDTYTMCRVAGGDVGGLYEMRGPQFEGVPSHWMTYIWVDDVDAATTKARSMGATVMSEPMDIPGVGKMAVLQDPAGATFAIYKGTEHSGAARLGPVPGAVGWNELMTTDVDQAKAFYSALFGWGTRATDLPTGGEYVLFRMGDNDVGGLMAMSGAMWQGIPPHWMTYVAVADVDAAVRKTGEMGGKVHVPATDIPGIGRFAVLEDPTGAVFSVIKFAEM